MASERVTVQEREGPARCGLCHADIGHEPQETCAGCKATHHAECLRELGACGTLGCPSQDRAAARIRIEPGAPLRCCPGERPWLGGSGVVACGGCGGRWHAACLGTRGCCGPVLPEQRPRLRDQGPRVGSERPCTSCGATFRVRARARYSTHCEACAGRHARRGLLVILFVGALYLLLNLWPLLLG